MTRDRIYEVLSRERDRQDNLWGMPHENPHQIDEWMDLMSEEIREAFSALTSIEKIKELIQAIAVGIACLEQFEVGGYSHAPRNQPPPPHPSPLGE